MRIDGLEYDLEYHIYGLGKCESFRCPLCKARVVWECDIEGLFAMVNRDPDPRGMYSIAVFKMDGGTERTRVVYVVDESMRNGTVLLFSLHTDTCPRASELKWGGAS